MAKFAPQKIDLAAINEGNRYGFEGIHPDAINRPIEASAYAQEIAESVKGLALNQPDSSQAYNVGTPTVEISGTGENAKFVFKNLKGEQGLTGPSGVASGTVNSNEHGTSQTNGYTQYAVNTLVSNPNLLINSNFAINQRGQTSYRLDGISVDCWKSYSVATIVPVSNGIEFTSSTSTYVQILQVFDIPKELLDGKTVTLSCSVNGMIYTKTVDLEIGMPYNANLQSVAIPGIGNACVRWSPQSDNFYFAIFDVTVQNPNHTTNTFNWAKVEIGSVATRYDVPTMSEELVKCRASSLNEYYNSDRVESNNFPTSSAQTSENKFFSEKAVYDNFVLKADPNGMTCLNIVANANLNNCVPSKAGQIQFWTAPTIGVVQTLKNSPTLNETFYMISQKQWIDANNTSATRETQMAVTMSGVIYTRGKGNIGGTATSWSNWKEISMPTEWQTFDSITDNGRTFTLPSYGTYEIKMFYNSQYYIFRATYSNDTDYYGTVMGELKNNAGTSVYTVMKSGNQDFLNSKIWIYRTGTAGAQDITTVLGENALTQTLYRRISD